MTTSDRKTVHLITLLLFLSTLFYFIYWWNTNFNSNDKEEVIRVENNIVKVDGIYGKASYYDYCLKNVDWCSYGSLVAASRDFARYSTVKVTNIHNGKSVTVKITDYGPMNCEDRILNGFDTKEKCKERVIDLSSHAFSQLDLLQYGLQDVVVELVEGPKK